MASESDIPLITAAQARELLSYNPATGKLIWRERPREYFSSERDWKKWNQRYQGKPAFDCDESAGYCKGHILGRTYRAHRIIWLLETGDWPEMFIDHINRNRKDNRWENLRHVTGSQNNKNSSKRRDNTSGINGVSWSKEKRKWVATIFAEGRHLNLGYFDDIEQAKVARLAANDRFGFSKDHGASGRAA